MPNHPNHPNRTPEADEGEHPTPEQIRTRRLGAGMTQAQAAELIHASLRAWEQWEAGERRMAWIAWWGFDRRLKDRKL